MRVLAYTLIALSLASQTALAQSPWLTDYSQALTLAQQQKKNVLVDFTGSDWCGWCMKLEADTLSKPEFLEYAQSHFVLVRLDYPRKKALPPEMKQANAEISKKYNVHGFPTLLELSPDGSVLWTQRGYLPGGPAAMIAKLEGGELKPAPAVAMPASPPPPVNLAAIFPSTPVVQNRGGEPKLQGIFYSSTHPAALLQGKTCEVGDVVGGMRVLKIAPDKVTVEWKGKTKDLTMN